MSAIDRHCDLNSRHAQVSEPAKCSWSIDWYSEGETRIVEGDGVRVIVRFVGRHGRRGRIAITAPPGAAFRSEAATPK
jgi:hypothetical protein